MTNNHDPLSVLHGDDLPVAPDPGSRHDCASGWNRPCIA